MDAGYTHRFETHRFLLLLVIAVFTKAFRSDGCGLNSRSGSDRFPLFREIAVFT
jgi:hypothetical protein